MAVSVSLVGCGKKAEVKGTTPVREVDPVQGEIEKLLEQQTVDCENGIACPSGIAKIAVVDRNKLKFCTGFLVNSLTLATSSSCLTDGLRLSADSDSDRCGKDLHIYFPRNGFNAQKRVACKQILMASTLTGKDPTLWRNDITYIEMAEPVYRRSFRLSREGVDDGKALNMWKMDATNDIVGVIRKEECQTVVNSYINPLSENKLSPVITLAGCNFQNGNTGAILLGSQGKWRGIVSQPVDQTLLDFLNNSGMMVEPLDPLIHASNSTCLPSVLESDPVTERECMKDLNTRQLDLRRADMLNAETPYQSNRGAIRDQVNNVRPYFAWDVQLNRNNQDNAYRAAIAPKCMNKVAGWIDQVGRGTKKYTYSMQLPEWKLLLGFDHGSRLVSRIDDSKEQKIFVQFSPRNAWNTGKTEVTVWREGSQGTTYTLKACDATNLEEEQ